MADASSLSTAAGLTGSLTGRRISSVAEIEQATELYVRVFGYQSNEMTINPLLLQAMIRNGGSAVAVLDGDKMVGFAYGFAARDHEQHDFHYSQAAVIDPAYQSRGIGRALKLLQREVALEWGHTRMRWAFDPLLARNGHFNLNSLGAQGVEFVPSYYGTGTSDRIVVDWSLAPAAERRPDFEDAPRLGMRDWGHSVTDARGEWLAVPATAPEPGSTLRQEMAAAVRDTLERVVDGAHTVVSCQRTDDDTAAYLIVDNREVSP